MPLEAFKRHPDLWLEVHQLATQYRKLYLLELQRILDRVEQEFSATLSAKGFVVKRQGSVVQANSPSQPSFEMLLECPNAEDSFIGCLSLLTLSDSRAPRNPWRLVLHAVGPCPAPFIAEKAIIFAQEAQMRHSLEALKHTIAHFQPIDYQIMYYRGTATFAAQGGQRGPVAGSMVEVLDKVLE